MQDEIREIYPELNVRYSYSVLYNGFSCKLPKEIIESVRNLPYVEDVTEMLEINHMDFNDIIFKPREFDRKNQSTRHKRFLWKSEAEYIEGFLGKNE